MSLEVSRQTEARIMEAARRQGVSVDALLTRLIAELAAITAEDYQPSELPIWRVGVVGSLHRRDIYSDVP